MTTLSAAGESPSSIRLQTTRVNVLGVGVSVISMQDAVRLTSELISLKGKGYVCASDVHSIVEARSDASLRAILNHSFLTTPDGMPLVWMGRICGHPQISRVYGPDYMLEMCEASLKRGFRHFLYGGKPGVADKLKAILTERFPGIQVVGTYTPPFRELTEMEVSGLHRVVADLQPDIMWVGLGSPKQDRFMARFSQSLEVSLMVGVGAAFDFHTGAVKEAPHWLKRTGLQWVHRLLQEPRRLWKRYLICVPSFLWNAGLQLAGVRKFELDG